MSAVNDTTGDARAASASARHSARAGALVLGAVLLAFAAAFAIGSMSKSSSAHGGSTGQLAPASPLHAQASAQISVPGAAATIPALARVARPKSTPKPAQSSASSQTSASSAAAPTSSTPVAPTQTAVQQPVQPQPVVTQPAVHPTQPQQPVVVVHH